MVRRQALSSLWLWQPGAVALVVSALSAMSVRADSPAPLDLRAAPGAESSPSEEDEEEGEGEGEASEATTSEAAKGEAEGVGEVGAAGAEADGDEAGDGEPTDDEVRKRSALAAFEEARQLFLAEEFAAAAEAFRRSYLVFPSLEALLAAARAYGEAGATLEAIAAYEEYLEFEDENAERHSQALEQLRELQSQTGVVALRIEDPETIAELRVNDELVSIDAFPRRLVPGELVLTVRFVDVDAPQQIRRSVNSGETMVLEISAPQVVTPPVEPTPPVTTTTMTTGGRPPPPVGLRAAFWTGVGLTGVAGVAVVTLGGLTLRQRRLYVEGLCESDDGSCADGSTYPFAQEARFHSLRRATNVVVGVGVGVAVTTLVLGAILRRKQRGSAGRRVADRQWVPGAGGLALRF